MSLANTYIVRGLIVLLALVLSATIPARQAASAEVVWQEKVEVATGGGRTVAVGRGPEGRLWLIEL